MKTGLTLLAVGLVAIFAGCSDMGVHSLQVVDETGRTMADVKVMLVLQWTNGWQGVTDGKGIVRIPMAAIPDGGASQNPTKAIRLEKPDYGTQETPVLSLFVRDGLPKTIVFQKGNHPLGSSMLPLTSSTCPARPPVMYKPRYGDIILLSPASQPASKPRPEGPAEGSLGVERSGTPGRADAKI